MSKDIEMPKMIHYCWFGKKSLPEEANRYIQSWKKYLPDFEIIEWNEDNFDINSNTYVKEAYEQKKYAFVSDYVRLYALYNYGGIYMDTDVEIIKPLDKFLEDNAFIGFENQNSLGTGIIGSYKKNPLIKEFLNYYENRKFIKDDGSLDTKTNVRIITDIMQKKGCALDNRKQKVEGITIYPKPIFSPLEWNNNKTTFTKDTHAIHHFAGTWHSEKEKKRKNSFIWRKLGPQIGFCVKILRTVLGEQTYNNLRKKLL